MKKLKALLILLLVLSLLPCLPAVAEEADSLMEKGAQYESEGAYDKAFAAYDLASRVAPNDIAPMMAATRLHLLLDDPVSALAAVDKALAIAPASGECWLIRMDIHLKTENLKEAEADALYADVCGAFPSPAQYAQLGLLSYRSGDADKAAALFSLANPEEMTDDQRAAYRKALLLKGEAARARELGLSTSGFRNESLDKAFEQGSLSLKAIPLWPEDYSGFEALVPTAQLQERIPTEIIETRCIGEDTARGLTIFSLTEEEMRELPNGVRVLGLSPDGGILFIGGGEIGLLKGKQVLVLLPTEARGAVSEFAPLEELISQLERQVPKEGVVWSGDGRYAVITNYYQTLTYLKFSDPIVLDTYTGEVFLASAYAGKIMKGGSGTLFARFDTTGRYLYYLMFGGTFANRTGLMRHDLETGENVLCSNPEGTADYPALFELANGDWLSIIDAVKINERTGFYTFSPAAPVWTHQTHLFSLPMAMVRPTFLSYSENSGYALAAMEYFRQVNGICRFRPDEDFEDMDTHWIIDSLDAEYATAVPSGTLSAFDEAFRAMIYAQDMDPLTAGSIQCPDIFFPTLSPDGYYAIAYVRADGAQEAYLLIRLSDMAVRRIDVPDVISDNFSLILNPTFAPGIQWNDDGTLLIYQSDKTLGRFILQ